MPSSADRAADQPLGAWLADVARPAPAPGGGAVAAVILAHAAALVEMVIGYSDPTPHRKQQLSAAAAVRRDALTEADADAAASAALVAAFRLLPGDPSSTAAAAVAVDVAAACSVGIVATARRLQAPLEWSGWEGERRLRPDAAVAARLLSAATRAAAVNIRCNALTADPSSPATGALFDAERAALTFAAEIDALAAAITAAL